jgi:hypothetical protein
LTRKYAGNQKSVKIKVVARKNMLEIKFYFQIALLYHKAHKIQKYLDSPNSQALKQAINQFTVDYIRHGVFSPNYKKVF